MMDLQDYSENLIIKKAANCNWYGYITEKHQPYIKQEQMSVSL